MPPSERATVRRISERGVYDLPAVRRILEDGVFCHVAFVDRGAPIVIPMAYGLQRDAMVLHGMAASRLMGRLRTGIEACVVVTLFDGLVLAGSAFEHSMNYRSVVVFGRAGWIRSAALKLAALRSISDQVLPGRWDDVRPPTKAELRQTHVLALPLNEASAKVRSGPPTKEDVPWNTWTGVVPAAIAWGWPEPEGRSRGVLPEYLLARIRPPHRA
jgi:uncharacterized protein